MYIPEKQCDLVLLPLWCRPPKANGEPFERRGDRLLWELHERPDLLNVERPDDNQEIFERALEFQKANRQGLYVAYMLVLALRRDPIACMTIAGMVAQHAKCPDIRNPRSLTRRAIGWLNAPHQESFVQVVGLSPEALSRIEPATKPEAQAKVSPLRRQLERNERRVTVVDGPLEKWRSESTNSERYVRLTKPLALAGDLDAAGAAQILAALRNEYPWAADLMADLDTALTLSLGAGNPWLALPPLLLVGPPGIGKTRFARRLSELANVPFRVVNAGGSSDNRDFAGTARGWSSARPARIVDILRDTETANPIVLLDEIEKVGTDDKNGRITETLLTMLEPETRGRFHDEALGTSVDLSHVNWVLTANDLEPLGRPLLSRVRIIHMPHPPVSAATKIIDSVLDDLGRRYEWPAEAVPELEPEVRKALVTAMAKGASPRNISVMLEQVFAIEIRRRRAG